MDKKNEKLNVEVFDYSTIPSFVTATRNLSR